MFRPELNYAIPSVHIQTPDFILSLYVSFAAILLLGRAHERIMRFVRRRFTCVFKMVEFLTPRSPTQPSKKPFSSSNTRPTRPVPHPIFLGPHKGPEPFNGSSLNRVGLVSSQYFTRSGGNNKASLGDGVCTRSGYDVCVSTLYRII